MVGSVSLARRLLLFFVFAQLFCFQGANILPLHITAQTDSSPTEFDIGSAHLVYDIQEDGGYSCVFIHDIVGNEKTSEGASKGEFTLNDSSLSNISLSLEGLPLNHSVIQNGNTTILSFTIAQEIPLGTSYQLTGNFDGIYTGNTSDTYTYQFGISWGTTIGSQSTHIYINARAYSLILPISPEPHRTSLIGYKLRLSWMEVLASGFEATIKLQKQTQEFSIHDYLELEVDRWKSDSQTIEIRLRNLCSFTINAWIIYPPWLSCDTSQFSLDPNEKRAILFFLTDYATAGLNGTIEIHSAELFNNLAIIVEVPLQKNSNSEDNSPNPFVLPAIAIMAVLAGLFGLLYHQRGNIQYFFQKRREPVNLNSNSVLNSKSAPDPAPTGVSHTPNPEWDLIGSRWDMILPERELRVLEILFTQGSMSQQAIADQMGISKGTMSRIISRLEGKGLLFRERFGMGNLIKLNKERL
jgi:hypothetical protein